MLDALGGVTWREFLALVIVFLVSYVALVLFRLYRLKREVGGHSSFAYSKNSVHDAVGAYLAVGAQNESIAGDPRSLRDASPAAPKVHGAGSRMAMHSPGPGDQYELLINDLEREVAQLRNEVGGLRAEVLLVREQMYQRPPESVAAPVIEDVSPYYADAMQLALQGLDADTISRQCAISRAEADLVLALVRNNERP